METIQYILKPEKRVDDLPEATGTNIAAAGYLVDEIAHMSGGMYEPAGIVLANKAMIGAQSAIHARQDSAAGIRVTEAEKSVAVRAGTQAEMLIELWWAKQTKSARPEIPVPADAVDRYRNHIGALSVAVQRLLNGHTAVSPAPVHIVRHPEAQYERILYSRTIADWPDGVYPVQVSPVCISSAARVLTTMWGLRLWERSILNGIAQESLETIRMPRDPSAFRELTMPVTMLTDLDTNVQLDQFRYADLLNEQSMTRVIQGIRRRHQEFQLRNTWWRRGFRRWRFTGSR